MSLEGVDISNHQPGVNFDVLARNVDFVILKATEGTTYVDPQFRHYRAECKRVGLIRGYYHFLRWDFEAATQARHFLGTVGPRTPGDLPPVVDVEKPGDGARGHPTVSQAQTALSDYIRELGVGATIYTYPEAWRVVMGNTTRFGTYPLWIASYPNVPLTLPGGWASFLYHQYTSTGRVPGIQGIVDRNRYPGTRTELESLAGLHPVPFEPPQKGIYFAETGHYVGGAFFEYWQHNNGLANFGYPLSEEFAARNGEWEGTAQRFERATFQYKPVIGPPFVEIALLAEEVIPID